MSTTKDNTWEDTMWDSYNFLMKCPDVDRLRKILVRHELFQKSLTVPGDIVECGVFKGTGLMQFLKMRQMHMPGSMKKVIGFDLFTSQPKLEGNDDVQMSKLFTSSNFKGIQPEDLQNQAKMICGDNSLFELVAGDVCTSCSQYVENNPGFRISFLHMDLDVGPPTLEALKALWPRIVRGGIVVFDEYAISRWSESQAVDEFLKDMPDQVLQTIPWAKSPTAYLIKK
ncbi:8-demethyl-8-(2,3-dimethoxy-alpha-L-rhamnosyl)-tetracenomycin-C 4'-O-methyltransferase-like [Antedon mediterranea]|uniref:8-demethyl-8-(2, 3-dimethoxy-alpha-L-rhamnosyl)-tetracenomycin-C 4'-O-methyltransferase-like n=1 Tax=Antedon mediterranea TaxID=105859 RepID=UPI003AF978F8